MVDEVTALSTRAGRLEAAASREPAASFEFTHMDLQARTYGEVAKSALAIPPAKETTASQQNRVRAQLNALTEILTKIHEAKDALSNEPSNKGHFQARIKQLETALAAIPEDDAELANERASLATWLTDTKRQLLGSKLIGAQIDGARAALGRARQRQAEAEQAVAAALQLQHTAACEVTALETELQEREASLTTEAPIEATATHESQAYTILGQMIDQLTADEYVHPGHVEDAAAGAHVSCALLLGKVQLLEQAFHDERLDFVFIQEGRARAAEVRRGLRYTMHVGASDNMGGRGCQAWVRAAAQFRASSYAAPSSRLYWAMGRDVQGIPFILVSAHAPSDRAPTAERGAVWDLLLQTLLTLRDRTPSAKMFPGIDANGRAGADHSGAIGACDSEAIAANGSDLLSVLARLRLAAVDAFYDVGYAWRSGKGPASRIDCVCGPLDELSRASVSYVPREMQLSLTAKAFRFDKWRLGDPAWVQAFQTMPRQLQAPVDASVDEKTQVMMSQVRTAARHSFGRPEDRPRQPWVSDHTRSILRLLAPSRRVAHAAGREAHRAYFRRIFLGGRMQNVRERKGPLADCDESRGIALEDRAARGLKQLDSHMATGPCQGNIPEVQRGADAGRGTDYAAHLVHSFEAYCNATGRSSFVWLVDLAKAFDRIVREVVLGWPCDATDPEACLAPLGLDPDQSAWIVQWVARHGCLFVQWGVRAKVIRPLKNLHAAAWFSYGDVDAAIVARAGGRQGCKYGAVVFNGTFSLAMAFVRVPGFLDADPAGPNADPEVVSLVGAAFVDDEYVMLMARLPKELRAAIDVALRAVCDIYDRPSLAINRQRASPSASSRTEATGPPPGYSGAECFPTEVLQSLHPDLGYYCWWRCLQMLNGVNMRVLRRVGDAPRFGHSETDLEIRKRLRQPSLDCLAMRTRLRYLGRLVRSSPPALLALLAARPGGARLPWVTLLVSDLGKLRELVAPCRTLPPPEGTASAWATFISDSPARWANSVSMLFFTDSCCDRGGAAPVGGGARPFACHQCDACFATAKARDQRLRIRHHVWCLQRSYAGADATCPVCHTAFGSRLRLLSHLCDSRRPARWDAIRASPARYPPLPQKQVAELDDLDKEMGYARLIVDCARAVAECAKMRGGPATGAHPALARSGTANWSDLRADRASRCPTRSPSSCHSTPTANVAVRTLVEGLFFHGPGRSWRPTQSFILDGLPRPSGHGLPRVASGLFAEGRCYEAGATLATSARAAAELPLAGEDHGLGSRRCAKALGAPLPGPPKTMDCAEPLALPAISMHSAASTTARCAADYVVKKGCCREVARRRLLTWPLGPGSGGGIWPALGAFGEVGDLGLGVREVRGRGAFEDVDDGKIAPLRRSGDRGAVARAKFARRRADQAEEGHPHAKHVVATVRRAASEAPGGAGSAARRGRGGGGPKAFEGDELQAEGRRGQEGDAGAGALPAGLREGDGGQAAEGAVEPAAALSGSGAPSRDAGIAAALSGSGSMEAECDGGCQRRAFYGRRARLHRAAALLGDMRACGRQSFEPPRRVGGSDRLVQEGDPEFVGARAGEEETGAAACGCKASHRLAEALAAAPGAAAPLGEGHRASFALVKIEFAWARMKSHVLFGVGRGRSDCRARHTLRLSARRPWRLVATEFPEEYGGYCDMQGRARVGRQPHRRGGQRAAPAAARDRERVGPRRGRRLGGQLRQLVELGDQSPRGSPGEARWNEYKMWRQSFNRWRQLTDAPAHKRADRIQMGDLPDALITSKQGAEKILERLDLLSGEKIYDEKRKADRLTEYAARLDLAFDKVATLEDDNVSSLDADGEQQAYLALEGLNLFDDELPQAFAAAQETLDSSGYAATGAAVPPGLTRAETASAALTGAAIFRLPRLADEFGRAMINRRIWPTNLIRRMGVVPVQYYHCRRMPINVDCGSNGHRRWWVYGLRATRVAHQEIKPDKANPKKEMTCICKKQRAACPLPGPDWQALVAAPASPPVAPRSKGSKAPAETPPPWPAAADPNAAQDRYRKIEAEQPDVVTEGVELQAREGAGAEAPRGTLSSQEASHGVQGRAEGLP
ncbi:unnamed protein product [Prorocentrum cordatum]|uniref:C2H2-type domain-containing protein n=1 Tax=Prorocentrum cordatum TaxID=2364126 RepID=A0ABN9T385_9DINO|nr:unnamed protein product [Polarella glacialis]